MQIDLTNTNVLVTGASRGIGAAIARAMGSAGARVAVHYRDQRARAMTLATEVGRGSEAFQADLADTAACTALWHAVMSRFGRIHTLINNAGIAVSSPLEAEVAGWAAGWDATMAVNLRAPGILSKLAIQHFLENGGGRIINISSRAAFRGDQPPYLAYAASKAGLVALTRSVARGFGKAGVLAFNVAPGFTRTDMARDFIDQYGEDHASGDIALTRMTDPDDIAPIVVFLASGLADHATGCTIDVNAGSYVH
ncbi:MAG: SDR family NAD(P)-dependent oxidoreductase [Rhodospirillales bacterium]|nr:SDR family NAD(P)-dependent oxidoreductase [Rhodospirillales bacterium]